MTEDRQATDRVNQVLRLVAAGERDVDIARILGIGVRTVRGYLDRIRDKLGERRRAGLVRKAIQFGLASPPEVPGASRPIAPRHDAGGFEGRR